MEQRHEQIGEDQYVVAGVQEALASDERLGETALNVSVTGRTIFVTGDVATAERREAISQALTERFPDFQISNATSVYEMIESAEEERL